MPTFSGKFQYVNADGAMAQSGACRVSFETETFTLTPTPGAPLALDLGDIDVFLPGDYELTLTLYTGKKIVLNQFGKTFQNLCHDLLEAYRKRLVQCLVLEDLEEIARFDAAVRLESPRRAMLSPAELRLYRSNLAVLPTAATGLQWRLADIDAVNFEPDTWTVRLQSADECLFVTKLARRTEEFQQRLADALEQLAQQGAETVHNLFPFLDPDQCQQTAALMKEGHAAPLARLRAIHPQLESALTVNAMDDKLKPYYDLLRAHVPEGNYYAGFKILPESDDEADKMPAGDGPPGMPSAAAASAPDFSIPHDSTFPQPYTHPWAPESAPQILHWYFLPLAPMPGEKFPGNLVAWEATSRSGRATYFFRLVPPEQAPQLRDPTRGPRLIDAAIQQLNRAIALLNFRREPIYLPDDSLRTQPRFRRYAIARRKLPELAWLRQSFLGRAIHTTPAAWQKQFESFLANA